MLKGILVLLMFALGLGLTQPSGYMQHCNLQQQYAQCSAEDHDITPLDFVFEHLLNLESIVNLFEGEHEYSGSDTPHQPSQLSEVFAGVPIAMPNQLHFQFLNRPFSDKHKQLFAFENDMRLLAFQAAIFRPPIA